MGRRRAGFFLLLFGLLLAIAVGGFTFVQAQRVTAPPVELAKAVVTQRDIPARTLIDSADLTTADFPKASIPPNAIVNIEDAKGKMTTSAILAREMVLAEKLADTKGKSGLAFAIPSEKVVITFPTSDIFRTGAIRVGDTVDLLVTVDVAKALATPVAGPGQAPTTPSTQQAQLLATQAAFQNLEVLAIGTTEPQPAGKEKSPVEAGALLTFAVSHQDALILKQLKDNPDARVELVLRPAGDTKNYATNTVTMKSIVQQFNIIPPP